MSRDEEALVGSDAIAVESIVITLLSPFLLGISTGWDYFFVFQLALGGVIAIMLFRVMAGKADNPNMNIVERSLRWSSKLLEMAIIGALAAISVLVNSNFGLIHAVALFTGFAFALFLSLALLDQWLLGEFASTWSELMHEETDDNVFGRFLRNIGDTVFPQFEAMLDSDSTHNQVSSTKFVLLGVGLLAIFLLVSMPIWLALAEFLGNVGVAVLVVLSLVFLRDVSRYLYIQYGAASSISELRWKLRWEFTWTILMGVLLSAVLGYNIMAVI